MLETISNKMSQEVISRLKTAKFSAAVVKNILVFIKPGDDSVFENFCELAGFI
jgi:hypothetical protein